MGRDDIFGRVTVLLCPDKFKGSLGAAEACAALARGLRRARPDLDVLNHPMADGGDGSLAVLRAHLPLVERRVATTDPLGRPLTAAYLVDERSGEAYVELSAASGLALLAEGERDPARASTLGTGALLADAVARGHRRITLLLGGSATHDVALGIAHALGARFLDRGGRELAPRGESLARVARVDLAGVSTGARAADFRVLVDVSNPLCGPSGAAASFARQKGADGAAVARLADGTRRFADRLAEVAGARVDELPGGGAAGGVAAGMAALFGASVEGGFGFLAAATGLAARVAAADAVVTGEGRLDATSLRGKVVGGVAALCARADVPLHAVAGAVALSEGARASLRLASAWAVLDEAGSVAEAMRGAAGYLEGIGVRLGGRL